MTPSFSRIPVRRLQYSSALRALRGPVIHEGFYPRDHKPGTLYPETEEERKAAAIKYGMRPEDYRPIDKHNIRSVGDYPDAGLFTFDHKDPYENWSNSFYRRNWGEMMHIDSMRYRPDRLTFTGLDQEDFKHSRAAVSLLQVMLPILFIVWLGSQQGILRHQWKNPMMPKQYSLDYYRAFPFEDPKNYPILNYSFELLN